MLQHASVGNCHVPSPSVHRHLHQRSGADQLYRLGHSDLYGGIASVWHPDRLPADLHCPRQCGHIRIPCAPAEGHPADPADLHPAAVSDQQALRRIPRRARG